MAWWAFIEWDWAPPPEDPEPPEAGLEEGRYALAAKLARERLDACIFYDHPDEGAEEIYRPGTYLVEILEGTTVIGSTEFSLR